MFVAHLVPGYFAAALTQRYWPSEWGTLRRSALWAVALGSTAAPDTDVIYNLIFRGFFGHSVLWTHGVFPHLGLAAAALLLRAAGRWPYLQMALWLAAVGGLSHVALDAISHGTTVLYPFTRESFGALSPRVQAGGVPAYLSDPVFLLEPALMALAFAHWLRVR